MKKITFDDRFGLTQAVLDGRKTMARKIIKAPKKMDGIDCYGFCVVKRPGSDEVVEVLATDADGGEINIIEPPYKVGEEVAIAQKYSQIFTEADLSKRKGSLGDIITGKAWDNKMFVQADVMPHRIRITNVWVERLQDISDEDCLREGIIESSGAPKLYGFKYRKCMRAFHTAHSAFAFLINKVSGKGTFASNPWVFVYEFELVK